MEEVRLLSTPEEVCAALKLSRRVFDEFVGPDYSEAGRNTFRKVTEPEDNVEKWRSGEYVFYGAFDGEVLAGTAASRANGSHVMLLFVDSAYHRRGIARLLMKAVKAGAPEGRLTVNASPYAVEAYVRMGFIQTGCPYTRDGIIAVPMEYRI